MTKRGEARGVTRSRESAMPAWETKFSQAESGRKRGNGVEDRKLRWQEAPAVSYETVVDLRLLFVVSTVFVLLFCCSFFARDSFPLAVGFIIYQASRVSLFLLPEYRVSPTISVSRVLRLCTFLVFVILFFLRSCLSVLILVARYCGASTLTLN